MEAAIKVRIVDEALPPDRRARFLEIAPQDDNQLTRIAVSKSLEAACIVERGRGIVDRTRADDRYQPRVAALEDADDRLTGVGDELRSALADRNLFDQDCRRIGASFR